MSVDVEHNVDAKQNRIAEFTLIVVIVVAAMSSGDI